MKDSITHNMITIANIISSVSILESIKNMISYVIMDLVKIDEF